MRILVTGGAGYIGSHAVRLFLQRGHDVTVYDSLIFGHRKAVPADRLVLLGIVVAATAVLAIVYARKMFGLATSAVAENRRVAAKVVVPAPLAILQVSVAPVGPWKHAVLPTALGAVTRAVVASVGTPH